MKSLRLLSVLVLALLPACDRAEKGVALTPEVQQFRSELADYPEYSIQLLGLKSEPATDAYYHQHKLVWTDPSAATDSQQVRFRVTPWTEITRKQFEREQEIAGTVIFRKQADGTMDSVPTPPQMLYVGDSRYGSWRSDENGHQYWHFAQSAMTYMLMAQVLDEVGDRARHRGRVYRRDHDAYRSNPSTYRTTYSSTHRASYQPREAVGTPSRPATFHDRVRERMSSPGTKAVPVSATSSVPGPSNARPRGFAERVRERMDRPDGAAATTPSYETRPKKPASSWNSSTGSGSSRKAPRPSRRGRRRH